MASSGSSSTSPRIRNVVLIALATVDNPSELQNNATWLVFIVVFFVDIGTATRLLLWGNQQ